MNPVVENVEIQKNNFSKWIHLAFTIICIVDFLLCLKKSPMKYGIQLLAC